MNRRSVLKVGAASLASAALSMPAIRTAQAAPALTVFTPFGFGPDYIEIMNAKAAGYFAKEGIDVTVRGAQGTAQVMQQLVSGEGQVVRSAQIDQMRLVQKQKLPILCISTLYQASNFYLISAKDKPITDAAQLKGKTIGLVSVGGTTSIYLDVMLAKAGLSKDDVKRETTGNSPGAFQLVKQGRIDAFIATHAAFIPLERAGEQITYFSTDKYAPMPNQGYHTTRDYAQKNPEAVIAFLRALKTSCEELLTQPHRPIFERAAKQFDIQGLRDMDSVLAISARWPDLLLAKGRENLLRNVPELWQAGVDVLASVGFLDKADPKDFYTDSFIDTAIKGLSMVAVGDASKTQRLYLLLRHSIVSGEVASGERLPSEPDLGAIHSVSRVTVRRVLGQLEDEGLISRQPGAGTFARGDGVHRPVVADLSNALASLNDMGRATRVRLLSFNYVPAPAPIASGLKIAAATRTQRSVRVRSAGDEPFSYLIAHVPEQFGTTYSEQDLASGSLLALLERSGIVIARATQTMTATLARPDIAQALAIDIGAPLLSLTRVVFDHDGNGLEHLQAFYRPDRYSFEMHLERSSQSKAIVWAPSPVTRPTRRRRQHA